MARERSEGGYDLFPQGRFIFTVTKPVEKRKNDNGNVFYLWRLKGKTDEGFKPHTFVCMPWNVGPILEALGYRGQKDERTSKVVYDWDREEVDGRSFFASVKWEPDFKDKTKSRANLYDFAPCSDAGEEGENNTDPVSPGEPAESVSDAPEAEEPIGF